MAFYDNIPEGYAEEDSERAALSFHYSRRERIQNAPKIVQDYYAGKMNPPKGLFRVLVANRFNRFMLFTMMLCLAVVLLVNAFASSPALGTCAGFETELTAFRYDDGVYAQVKIHALKKSLADKNFDLDGYIKNGMKAYGTFTFWTSDGGEWSRLESVSNICAGEFFLRTNVPDYDIMAVSADIKILDKSVQLKTNAIKKL